MEGGREGRKGKKGVDALAHNNERDLWGISTQGGSEVTSPPDLEYPGEAVGERQGIGRNSGTGIFSI